MGAQKEKYTVGKLIINAGDTNEITIDDNAVTVGSTMTSSPETTAEDAYITVTIAGVDYQIPLYAA